MECSHLGKRHTHYGKRPAGKGWKTAGDVLSAVLEKAETSYPDRMKQIKLDDKQYAEIAEHLLKEILKPCGDPFAWFYNHVLFPVAGIDYRATPEKERELVQMLALALGTIWTKKTTVQPAETDYKW